MRITATVLILIISLLMAGPAIAEPLEDATKAYEQGDYKTAYRLFGPLAEQGLPEAQYHLGIMYRNGQGVLQDNLFAHMWFNLAASLSSASQNEYRDAAATEREAIATKLTPSQLSDAQRMAREWKPKVER